ncbi:LysE family translocator [Phaeobacter gallaeciensis]|uniref:LysE family translocator n=2 Tax=Roseobacteraceae TaxID=2854170 RepID=A0A366WM50_9RHOB|nr:LysE family translocator [Phaeobacter gallaeciensis]MBT3140193.1 LysE family translocator [Falsiruegeria litorea]MBT8169048.1 LysE family translocator [Falsiruegeria litorea]RBW50476.1 LysE family translocator [Phaeobacter gallaeciensis]
MIGPEWAALWLAWIVAGGSPGPATLSIAGTSMNTGRQAGLIFAGGILFGSAAWGLAAAAGMSAVMLANVWLFEMLRYGGAAYLFWLALKSLRSALSADVTITQRAYNGSALQIFSRGALIHLMNPKAILSWASVYSLVLPVSAGPEQVFGLFAFLYSGSILVFLGYAILFSTPRVVAYYLRLRRGFEFTFAGFFGFASLKILTARLESSS